MDDRYRQLPPRIEPRYETQPVSEPPPLPEVEETVGLTAAGQVQDISRFADGMTRTDPVRTDPGQRGAARGPDRAGRARHRFRSRAPLSGAVVSAASCRALRTSDGLDGDNGTRRGGSAMSEDREGDDRAADEEFKARRHDRFGKLPPRVEREKQIESKDTEPPHEEPEEPPVRREWG